MRKIYTYFMIFSVAFITLQMNAQTETNIQALNNLSLEFANEWDANQLKVQQYVQEHDVPITQELEDGTFIQMVNVVDGMPVYYMTDNIGAAYTTRANELWEGGSSGLNLSGEGYDQLGEWDGGAVRNSHQEFTDQGTTRVTQMDGATSTHYHATHVAGTLIAAGVEGDAKGMSHGANLKAWQWSNDLSEMAAAAAQGLEISNHSYGSGAGWESNGSSWVWQGSTSIDPKEDYKFGFYNQEAKQLDQIAYNAPNYLIFRSAGNERGEGPSYAGTGDNPEIDGGDDHYDCIQPEKGAKNVMTVGAAYEVMNYTGPEDVEISNFSSQGPMDDGRIKPDIVGKGVDVYSTMDNNNTAYSSLSGTSMSTPNTAGSAALLQHYYQQLNGEPMKSATLKGLIIHTADEAGEHEGPDYVFGWGLMNAQRAAELISEDTVQNVIEELVLDEGNYFDLEVEVPEASELRVTICWTDPAANVPPVAINDRTPMLVNDLDIKILDADNNIHYPYKLDPDDKPAAATTDSRNNVDNVEMIYIADPVPGTYTIFIDHEDELTNGSQAFSLIMSGIDEFEVTPDCSFGMLTPEDGSIDNAVNQTISWAAASFAISYDVYFGTDGDGTTTPGNIYDGENISETSFDYAMELGTTYYLQIIPRNSVGTAEGCEEIWSFTTIEAIDEYPYFEDLSEVDVPEIPELWQVQDYSEAEWKSTNLIGNGDKQSMLCFNPDGIVETDYDNWFVSPPFAVETGKEYNISYYYKNLIAGHTETMSLYWGYLPEPEAMENQLFTDSVFDSKEWLMAEALFVPENDGAIYLGWHAESIEGFGIVLDDMLVEDWGTVGTSERKNENDPRIYSYSGKVFIQADATWQGAEIQVINMMGQTIFKGAYQNQMALDMSSSGNTGIYIITLRNHSNVISEKVMIK